MEMTVKIDFTLAREAFERYLDGYDRKEEKIRLKIVHTYGVVADAGEIAARMGLSEEDQELARLIALLHDIGRFEQIRRYDSFQPDTMDHAAYGALLLFGEAALPYLKTEIKEMLRTECESFGEVQKASEEMQSCLGERLGQPGETQKQSGETQKQSGETQKQSGEAQKQSGETQKQSGEMQDCPEILPEQFAAPMIRKFIQDQDYDGLICQAIACHSDFSLPEIRDERILLHARLIRDADKLDNCRVKLEESLEAMLGVSREEAGRGIISPKVWEACTRRRSVLSSDRVSYVDYWVSYLAQYYDLYFSETWAILLENDYINRIAGRLDYPDPDTADKMAKLAADLNAFGRNRIQNGKNPRL